MDTARDMVERYTPTAYRMAFHLTGNAQDAADLVQNAMLRVLRSYGTYDPAYKFEQWLYRILKNLYIDRLRLAARRREDSIDSTYEEGGRVPSASLVDPAPTPDQVLDREADREAVRTAVMQLPLESRMAVALVDLENFSYEEAAKMLEIPVSTLGVRVHRGRKRLRKLLEEHWRNR